jgi:hypothetical protein
VKAGGDVAEDHEPDPAPAELFDRAQMRGVDPEPSVA